MHYPDIDPVIFAIGPLAIRWYGLAYLGAFAMCWWLGVRRAPSKGWTREEVADIVFYGAVGAVLGGRIGYVLFYAFEDLIRDPLFLVRIWDGGMSFHGGLLGTLIALWWFGSRTSRSFLQVSDFVAPLVPIGLGFGRLGNFANTELPGRATDSVLGVIYPCSAESIRSINPLCTGQWEAFARHPSPLYQAFAEGVVLFALVWLVSARSSRTGVASGTFLIGYGILRFVTEFFRQPDAHIQFEALEWLTMGQRLSIPMVIVGILLLFWPRLRARGAGPG
ncbi:MAG: prolipoprotein diacylglyceryl transferase [Pseudomonadales bacterium]|nr:prolipoprotein diacylglyceryl transferase [Pseudomonadales bacterium]NIX07057.1 prolipoprotein diacylglyceryl transferase [Pseudomonadales bacterium]